MKKWVCMCAGAAMVAGCQAQKPQQQATRPSVLDVTAPPPSYQASAAPAPVTPSYMLPQAAPESAPLVPLETQTPVPAAAVTPASKSAKSAYTVKKGDTLYRIAKSKYGDGKQWQRIAAANPGVSPSSLHVGQKLLMP